jgi:hypothetical protein
MNLLLPPAEAAALVLALTAGASATEIIRRAAARAINDYKNPPVQK